MPQPNKDTILQVPTHNIQYSRAIEDTPNNAGLHILKGIFLLCLYLDIPKTYAAYVSLIEISVG